MANSILNELSKRALVRKGVLRQLGGWLPYSIAYIEECLFEGRGKDVIGKALTILLEMRFISQDVPKDVPEFYASGVTKWFRLNVEAVNKWIDTFYGGDVDQDDLDSLVEPVQVQVPDAIVKPGTQDLNYKGKKEAVMRICSFHRHIHNKPLSYVYDKDRKKPVLERLEEGRKMGEFAQAIIGCVLSPHHQGKNPDTNKQGKIYDEITLICRSATYFERFVTYALEKGVTEEIAFNEFKKVLAGGVSKYSKAYLKKQEEKQVAQERGIVRAIETLTPEELYRYNSFAKEMVTYFVIPTTVADIFATYRENEKLIELSEGLTNDDIMYECLVDNVKVFNPTPNGNILTNIQSFSRKLTEMLKMKK
jgi:hypothetical protein